MEIINILKGDETISEIEVIIKEIVETARKENKEIIMWIISSKYENLINGLGMVKENKENKQIQAFAFGEQEDFNI